MGVTIVDYSDSSLSTAVSLCLSLQRVSICAGRDVLIIVSPSLWRASACVRALSALIANSLSLRRVYVCAINGVLVAVFVRLRSASICVRSLAGEILVRTSGTRVGICVGYSLGLRGTSISLGYILRKTCRSYSCGGGGGT